MTNIIEFANKYCNTFKARSDSTNKPSIPYDWTFNAQRLIEMETELRAQVRRETLEEAIGLSHDYSDKYGNIYSADFRGLLKSMTGEQHE